MQHPDIEATPLLQKLQSNAQTIKKLVLDTFCILFLTLLLTNVIGFGLVGHYAAQANYGIQTVESHLQTNQYCGTCASTGPCFCDEPSSLQQPCGQCPQGQVCLYDSSAGKYCSDYNLCCLPTPPPSPPGSPPPPSPPPPPPDPPQNPYPPAPTAGWCPDWALDYYSSGTYTSYAYDENQWGGSQYTTITNPCEAGKDPHGTIAAGDTECQGISGYASPDRVATNDTNAVDAVVSAMCAWVAACKQMATSPNVCKKNGVDLTTESQLCAQDPFKYCLARTPAAIGVMYGESGISPVSQAWDGNGRGIIQFDYYTPVMGQELTCSPWQNAICNTSTPVVGEFVEKCNQCACLVGPGTIAKFPRSSSNYPVTDVAEIERWRCDGARCENWECKSFNPLLILSQAIVNSYNAQTFGVGSASNWFACSAAWPRVGKGMAIVERVSDLAVAVIHSMTQGQVRLSTSDFIKPDNCYDFPPGVYPQRRAPTAKQANDPAYCGEDCTWSDKTDDCWTVDLFKC